MKSLRVRKSTFASLNIESIKISDTQLDKVKGGSLGIRRGPDGEDGRRGDN